MRLRRPGDFRNVWNNGRSWAHPFFILWVLPNDTHVTRIGLTASKKVGNAVVRNRARRIMREAMRTIYPDVQPGLDIVLVGRKSIVQASSDDVRQGLIQLLNRHKLMKN